MGFSPKTALVMLSITTRALLTYLKVLRVVVVCTCGCINVNAYYIHGLQPRDSPCDSIYDQKASFNHVTVPCIIHDCVYVYTSMHALIHSHMNVSVVVSTTARALLTN